MKKLIAFFRTSPLSLGRLALHLLALIFLTGFFIIGGIYLLQTTLDIGAISFVCVGIILICAGIYKINPKASDGFLFEHLADDDATTFYG